MAADDVHNLVGEGLGEVDGGDHRRAHDLQEVILDGRDSLGIGGKLVPTRLPGDVKLDVGSERIVELGVESADVTSATTDEGIHGIEQRREGGCFGHVDACLGELEMLSVQECCGLRM